MSNEKLIEDLYTTTFSNNEAFFKRAADALAQADKEIEALRKLLVVASNALPDNIGFSTGTLENKMRAAKVIRAALAAMPEGE